MYAEFRINGRTIVTERLLLRPFKEEDLDDFYEYAKVPGVGEMAGWTHHRNKEETKEVLRMFIDDDKTFAIVLKENNKIIGSIGIEERNEEELEEYKDLKGRELGFVLSRDYWGKELMPEAIAAIESYLFDELNFDYLSCVYYDFNNQSKRVQEKCGFKPYKRTIYKTRMGTIENGMLNIVLNPKHSTLERKSRFISN